MCMLMWLGTSFVDMMSIIYNLIKIIIKLNKSDKIDFLIFILSLSLCLYKIYDLMKVYLDYEVITSTSLVNPVTFKLPRITICNSIIFKFKHRQLLVIS